MRKTALILVVLLLLSTVTPYNLFAESQDFKDRSSGQTVDEQGFDKTDELKELEQVEDSSELVDKDLVDESEDSTEESQLNDEIKEETEEVKKETEEVKKETEEVKEITEPELKNEKSEDVNEQTKMKMFNATVLSVSESSISKLGHIRNTNVDIYKNINDLGTSFKAGSTHTNAVYYIKRQALVGGQTYYLLSTLPSSVNGTIGWAKSSDLSTHTHLTVDKKSKNLYVKGTGSAYSKAWGGSKDLVYKNMSQYTGQAFKVNLTETVGNNTWYRGDLNGKRIWLHSSYVSTTGIEQTATSKLGHLRSGATIYENIGDQSSAFSSSPYSNAVYYIKSQAKLNGVTYYLISTQPSRTNGVIGWVKSSELSTHDHKTVDKKSKTLYFKGNGSAYSKAWGGNKDLVHKGMSKYSGQIFKVNLTETVGNNTWYRGVLNGETIWLHSSYLTTKTESNTSKLGHLSSRATIYKVIGDPDSIIESNSLLNAVYYIKKQASVNGVIFYLISTQPSRTNGVIGWVKSSELSTYEHKTVDKKKKTFFVTGTGSAYSKAWGGSKDLVYQNLSQLEGEYFEVNLTEKVGGNTWYRGILKGKTAWIHSSYVAEQITNYINYNITLAEALNIQKNTARPQTDKDYNTFVSKAYIDNNKVTTDTLNVRGGAGTNYWVVGQLKKGAKVDVIKEVGSWYQIEYTKNNQWVNPSSKDILYYLDPTNFINDERQKFQFLDLSRTSNASATVLNNYLKGKGTLHNQGQAFIDASRLHGFSDIYLISHSILETGHGGSTLAKGVMHNGVKVYNMFGIGAYDSCPVDCGAKRAYDEGWTTPYKAIIGGAEFIGDTYIKAGQNTLYKMRWNPAAMDLTGKYGRQYATDIGWASKQIRTMYDLYQTIGIYNLNLEIPVYKK